MVVSSTTSLEAEEKTSWGIYQIHWGNDHFEDSLKKQIEQLGATPRHVLFFRDMHSDRGFPTTTVEVCKQHGITPVISKELWLWREKKRDPKESDWLGRINSGKTDDYWREWAKDAKAFEDAVILRFGFEMNGDWFAWGQQPEAFKEAWKRVHSLVRDEGGALNVQFMFAPNVEFDEKNKLVAIEPYYPGDEFVELLGLDGYNFGDSGKKGEKWQTYDEVFEKSIAKMSQAKKPLILSEIGCADGPRKAGWMKDFLKKVSSDSRVQGFIYYNNFDPKKEEQNWELDSDPETLKIFKAAIKEDGAPKLVIPEDEQTSTSSFYQESFESSLPSLRTLLPSSTLT